MDDEKKVMEEERIEEPEIAPEDSLERKIKRARRNRIIMIVVAVLIVAAILFAIFVPKGKGTATNGTAMLEIRCDQLSEDLSLLNDKTLEQYIPKDGTILAATVCGIESGKTTVFDLLEEVCLEKDIQLEYNSTPVYGGSYIEGINYLYEYSAGKYSGWKFTVNGKVPSYAADKVKLNDGDVIVWYYSVDYRPEGM